MAEVHPKNFRDAASADVSCSSVWLRVRKRWVCHHIFFFLCVCVCFAILVADPAGREVAHVVGSPAGQLHIYLSYHVVL